MQGDIWYNISHIAIGIGDLGLAYQVRVRVCVCVCAWRAHVRARVHVCVCGCARVGMCARHYLQRVQARSIRVFAREFVPEIQPSQLMTHTRS